MKRYLHGLPFVIILLLGLTPLIWFIGRGNVLINGVDTNFPLDPIIWFLRRLFVWNNVQNAGMDFSASTAGLFFHLVQIVPFMIGFSLQTTQIISLIFWFGLIIVTSFIFAKHFFPRSLVVQLLFVCFYAFNIYLFNTWENVKVANLSLVAGIPFGLYLIDRINTGKISCRFFLLLCFLLGIVLSGSGINPAYLICFFLIISIFQISSFFNEVNISNFKILLINFLLLSFVIFLTNSFWILPTAKYIVVNIPRGDSIGQVGFNNWVNSLSENTSLLNVLRLQGAWDWYSTDLISGLPLYIPYALNYFHRLPFLIFSFILVGLTFLSFIFKNSKQNVFYIFFGCLLIIGVFLGAGSHPPTGILFTFLADKIPFFSLFRSPWYIFTPLVTLSLSGLIALLFYNFNQNKFNFKLSELLISIIGGLLILANFIYTYPLIQGKIFRPLQQNNFYIKFPDYVFASGKWLNSLSQGRIISYPDDEIERFDFGYIGIESILELLSNKETIYKSLNATNSSISLVINEFYSNLKKGQLFAVYNLAKKLNATLLFEKGDQISLSPNLPTGITSLPLNQFGKWNFYSLPVKNSKIYIPERVYLANPYSKSPQLLSLIDSQSLLVNPEDSVISKNSSLIGKSNIAIIAKNSQEDALSDFMSSPFGFKSHLKQYNLNSVGFSFRAPVEGDYQVILEKNKLNEFGIDINLPIPAILNNVPIELKLDTTNDSFVYFKLIHINKGDYTLQLNINNPDLLSDGSFQNGLSSLNDFKGVATLINDKGDNNLSLLNQTSGDVSLDMSINNFDPYIPYYIQFSYKHIYGNHAQVLIEQFNKNVLFKTQTETVPDYPEWITASLFFEPVKAKSEMKLRIIAPAIKDPLGTKILYDDFSVRKVFTNHLILLNKQGIDLPSSVLTFKQISPVLYEGEVTGAIGDYFISFLENYSPAWKLSISPEDQKINLNPDHLTGDFYANTWYIKNSPSKYKFKIYYTEQNLYYLGIVLAIFALTLPVVLYLVPKIRTSKK